MSITELILTAKNKKASEVIFILGSEPKARIQGEWMSLRSTPVVMSEWNILGQSLLNGSNKNALETQGLAIGEVTIAGNRVGYSFLQQENVFRLLLTFGEAEAGVDYLPATPLLESVMGLQGFHLVSGVKGSKLIQTLQAMLYKINTEKSFVGVVVSSSPFAQIKEEKGSFIYASSQNDFWKRPEFLSGVDLVVLDGIHSEENLRWAVETAESGTAVIYTMTASSCLAALKRCYSALSSAFGKHGSSRFAEVVNFVYGQVALKGLTSEWVLGSEFLTVKPHIRNYIENEDMKSLESLFKGQAESAGVQSLNQSLLNHLVRRRVDLKSAFAVSRDPENLDALLKKVGV